MSSDLETNRPLTERRRLGPREDEGLVSGGLADWDEGTDGLICHIVNPAIEINDKR